MDRTPEEMRGVSQAIDVFLKHGILVAQPLFDRSGGDLLGFTPAGNYAAVCRIQAKFRDTAKKNNNVVIPAEYVEGAFVLFLVLKVGNEEHQLCLLPEDIKKHFYYGSVKHKKTKKETKVYRVTLSNVKAAQLLADKNLEPTKEKFQALVKLMGESSVAAQIYKHGATLAAGAKAVIEMQAKFIEIQRSLNQIQQAKSSQEKKQLLDRTFDILRAKMGFKPPSKSPGQPDT